MRFKITLTFTIVPSKETSALTVIFIRIIEMHNACPTILTRYSIAHI